MLSIAGRSEYQVMAEKLEVAVKIETGRDRKGGWWLETRAKAKSMYILQRTSTPRLTVGQGRGQAVFAISPYKKVLQEELDKSTQLEDHCLPICIS